MKVVNILHHTTPSSQKMEDVLFDGWQARFGLQIKKQYPKVDIECWLPSRVGGQVFKRNSLTFRTIHAIQPSFHSTICPSILTELRKSQEKDMLVHVFGERSFLTYFLLSMRRLTREFPIVVHHLGAGGGRGYFGGKFISAGFSNLESLVLPSADLIYTLSSVRLSEMNRFGVPKQKLKMGRWGVDLDFFNPLDKSECKKRLGISQDVKVVLYVGRFSHLRGLEQIIRSTKELSRKMDIELVAVGGSQSDSLSALVNKNLKHYKYRIPLTEMPQYYNAADVFAWYVDSDAYMYAGTGISPLEAFACGIPVVSNTLVNLREPMSPDMGVIPRSRNDLTRDIQQAMETSRRDTIRKYAERNFDWFSISRETMGDYDRLLTDR
ncbi:MAG: glycosyltransferase [Nitrososphaerota archaeon]|nr:glycosyltransferase [Nitrososphaerota archaeon]